MDVLQGGVEELSLESRPLNLDDSILKLCLKLLDTFSPTGNQCVSPTGVHQLLSVLITVCQSTDTKRKLIELLGLPQDFQSNELYDAWEKYLTTLEETPDSPLDVNLALFSGSDIHDADVRLIKYKLHCDFIVHDIDSKDVFPMFSREKLQNWIERTTAGTMKENNINFNYVRSILLSVLNFKCEFHKYLEWKVLKEENFFVDSYTSVLTDFMSTQSYIEYAENSDLEAMKLDYENRDYYLLMLRPKDGVGRTNRLEKILTASVDYLASLKFERKYAYVFMPKFLVQNEVDILAMLHRIYPDVNDLFAGRFEYITTFVNTVKQMNLLDVHERKIENYSKRDINWEVTLDFNSPFLYILCHKDKILFVGRICNPNE